MFVDQWSRRKRSMPILPGINGGYGSFVGQPSYSSYGKRNDDIDDILGQGFIGKWIHIFNILTFRFMFYLINKLTLYVTYSMFHTVCDFFGNFWGFRSWSNGELSNRDVIWFRLATNFRTMRELLCSVNVFSDKNNIIFNYQHFKLKLVSKKNFFEIRELNFFIIWYFLWFIQRVLGKFFLL